MKTVGLILQEERIKKKLTLEHVESATKIRKKFLVAMEADDFSRLPSVSYAKGFVKNYSDFLGLSTANMLAFFRRQTREVTRTSFLPKGVTDPLNPSFFQLTPGRFMTLFIVVLVGIFLANLTIQYRKLQEPPSLIIDRPADKVTVSERKLEVLGRTDPDATVSVNGVSVLVRGDGKFFDQMTLENGVNAITVTSTSRYGKSVTLSRAVTFTP